MNITATKYKYQFKIQNSPTLKDVERILSFYRQYKELNNINYIETEFAVHHFNNGVEIPELEKKIKLISDGVGIANYPRGLNVMYNEVDGEQVPSMTIDNGDMYLLNDLEFYLHWTDTHKSEKSLFDLIVLMHDKRIYDEVGNAVGLENGTHSFFDLKYSGVFKAKDREKLN
jgi:hypothetical protein